MRSSAGTASDGAGSCGARRIQNLPAIIAPPKNQGTLPANTLNAAFMKAVTTDGTLNHTINLIPGCQYSLSFQFCNLGARAQPRTTPAVGRARLPPHSMPCHTHTLCPDEVCKQVSRRWHIHAST